jgi:hypothetical protein
MMENKHADGIGAALLDRNDGLQEYRGGSRSNGVAFYVPEIRTRGSGQTFGAGRQVRQGAMRPQERAPDYRVVAAWSFFLLFIGAGAFVVGMAIHNESFAQQRPPRPDSSPNPAARMRKFFGPWQFLPSSECRRGGSNHGQRLSAMLDKLARPRSGYSSYRGWRANRDPLTSRNSSFVGCIDPYGQNIALRHPPTDRQLESS